MPATAAPGSPAECFDMALEAARIALQHMVPVILLSDGYLANGSEPWKLPKVEDLPDLRELVKDVAEPAKAAGIQKHDILLAIEDTEILDGAQLKNYLIERTNPGQEVSVKVRRVDVDLTFHVILGGG